MIRKILVFVILVLMIFCFTSCDRYRSMKDNEVAENYALAKEQINNGGLWENGKYYYSEHQNSPNIYEEPYENAKKEFIDKIITIIENDNLARVSGIIVFVGPNAYDISLGFNEDSCKQIEIFSDLKEAYFSIVLQESEVTEVYLDKYYEDVIKREGIDFT